MLTTRLRSLLMWSYFGLSLGVLWVPAVLTWALTRPFDPRLRLLHRYTCWWGAHYVHASPLWTLTVEGREHLPAEGACVFVANHQSMVDILAIFGLRTHFKWVSKAVVFKMPFLGWNMSMNRYVRLERGKAESIRAMMEACRAHLRRGSPLMMFPEGTRSRDGRLRPFKHGAFTLACEAGVPVVPVVVEGARSALPKDGFLFRERADVLVRVLPAIAPAEAGGDPEALMDLTRARIALELARIRGVAPGEVAQP